MNIGRGAKRKAMNALPPRPTHTPKSVSRSGGVSIAPCRGCWTGQRSGKADVQTVRRRRVSVWFLCVCANVQRAAWGLQDMRGE